MVCAVVLPVLPFFHADFLFDCPNLRWRRRGCRLTPSAVPLLLAGLVLLFLSGLGAATQMSNNAYDTAKLWCRRPFIWWDSLLLLPSFAAAVDLCAHYTNQCCVDLHVIIEQHFNCCSRAGA